MLSVTLGDSETTPGLINTLPEEILLKILELAIGCGQPIFRYDDSSPDIYQRATLVSSICCQWRRIVVKTPAFWSLIPVIRSDCYTNNKPRFVLWIERSADAGLHVVLDPRDDSMGEWEPMSINSVLWAQASRFRTLNIVSDEPNSIDYILTLWFMHGSPGSVVEFSVACPGRRTYFLSILDWHDTIPRDAIEKFLGPLRTLRLRNFHLASDSTAFEGLIELELRDIVAIDVDDLVKIFRASPGLQTLTLRQITLAYTSGPLPSLPIVLAHLRTLYLEDLETDTLHALFRLISPTSLETYLSFGEIAIPDSSGRLADIDKLEAILLRLQGFNIQHMSLERYCHYDHLRILIRSLPLLRSVYFLDEKWSYGTPELAVLTKPMPNLVNFPSLRVITMEGTITDLDSFKTMVSSHELEQVRFSGQILSPHLDNPMRDLHDWLASCVPESVCINTQHPGLDYIKPHRPDDLRLW